MFVSWRDHAVCFQLVVSVSVFNKAVDEFYSKIEGQKIDLKALQQVWSQLVLECCDGWVVLSGKQVQP